MAFGIVSIDAITEGQRKLYLEQFVKIMDDALNAQTHVSL